MKSRSRCASVSIVLVTVFISLLFSGCDSAAGSPGEGNTLPADTLATFVEELARQALAALLL